MGIRNQSQFPNVFGLHGASLEHLVLSNSKEFYHSTSTVNNKWRAAAKTVGNKAATAKIQGVEDLEEANSCCDKKWCWWSPAQDSLPIEFCTESSIHGLKFMGQPKRHITERIFWLVAFLLSFAAAFYLIYEVWDRHHKIPVIVSFQASEQDIDSIPFPAVTLCNMNKFSKRKVNELMEIIKVPSDSKYNESRMQLMFVRSVCNAQLSFAKQFDFAFRRGTMDQESHNDTITEDSQHDMMNFLIDNTLPCGEFIRLCMFGEKRYNCSELFKPVITDYGKCCSFNILPLPLLLLNPQNEGKPNASLYDNPVLGDSAIHNWNQTEIDMWISWNYEDGFVLPKDQMRPWKQKRAGMPYGMSILVDPNLDDYFCPVSDSEGLRFLLHAPLEMPHVTEFASVADLNKEILIEVHPDMTNADDDIRNFERDRRLCYFGREKKLRFFGPYTGGNCMDECTAIVLAHSCSCTFFFMPRDDGVRICNNDPNSLDYQCIGQARIDLQDTLKEKCGHCDTLCEDIAYNYETTMVQLQNANQLWNDPDMNEHDEKPLWANHSMSIMHIFFGSETTVPKLRKRLYGNTDLIANTGGILGLCLGFSVLSGVEVIYFLTIRSFWKYCRKRTIGRRVANKFVQIFKSRSEQVIRVNPNTIPVYPSYHNGQFYGGNMQFIPKMYSKTPYGGNVGYY